MVCPIYGSALRLTGVQYYENKRGYRLVFQANRNLILLGDKGPVFIPKGEKVEVSIIQLPPTLGSLEAAIIYRNNFLAFRRGPNLTAEEILSKLVV